MEQHKIDKKIRKKLQDRAIQPSSQAWDRLDAMLAYQEVKAKRTFPWLRIAAVFVGVLMLGILWQVYDEQTSTLVPSENQVVLENQFQVNITEESKGSNVNEVSEDIKEVLYPKVEVKEALVSKEVPKEAVAESLNEPQYVLAELQQESEEIQDYAAARALLTEIDTEGRISSKNITPDVSGSFTVDAKSLLNTTENEIENSFRDKVIHKINKNYNALKSSVANRNNQ